jgi:drug/metabolite transporter (DMT)-like permease
VRYDTAMSPEYVWIGATALLWGTYPLISRSADYSGPRAALVLMVGGLVPVAMMAYTSSAAGLPSKLALAKLLLAGLMMGGGLVAFLRVASGPLEASLTIPIMDVGMLLVSAVGAMAFFAEAVTWHKLLGIGLLLGGIALLRPA